MNIELPVLDYREYQSPLVRYMRGGGKRAVWVAHRRSGKDVTCWQYLVEASIQDKGTYYYCLPEFAHARRVIWEGMLNDGMRFVNLIPKVLVKATNDSQMKIELVNGSIIQLVGSDQYDRLVGTNPKGIVFSEYSITHPMAWQILRPILAANGGWAIFNGTPRGKNHFHEILEMAKKDDTWFWSVDTAATTGVLSKDVLDKEKAEMDIDVFNQEYFCFPEGTNVFTSVGQRDISTIKDGEFVLSHTGRFRKVLQTMMRHYEGEMVTIRTYGDSKPIKCTPNHPIRVLNPSTQSYKWVRADNVSKGDFLVLPRGKIGNKSIPVHMARLIAWFIVEGSCFKNGVNFSLGEEERTYADEIESCLDAYGCKWKEASGDGTIIITAYSCALSDFLSVNCGSGAANKRIPHTLIQGHEQTVYDICIAGDGCYAHTEKETWDSFTTISESLAYDMQFLASTLGYKAGIGRRKPKTNIILGRECNVSDSFSVQIRRGGGVKFKPAKNGIGVMVRDVSREHFDGTVYNISVQYDESYVADGRTVHNCSFDAAAKGAYYSEQIMALREQSRVCKVPYEPKLPVYTAGDPGDAVYAVVYFQVHGKEIRIIDSDEFYSPSIEHIYTTLISKPYKYGKHFLPFDATVSQLATGKSIAVQLRDLGLRDIETLPQQKTKMEGIKRVQTAFASFWIDESLEKKVLEPLSNYAPKYSETRNTYSQEPEHNWASHMSDAVRYMVIALDLLKPKPKQEHKNKVSIYVGQDF